MTPKKNDFTDKIFDVKRTKTPPPSSKPVIVGHQPSMPDPMLQHDLSAHPKTSANPEPLPESKSEPAKIEVKIVSPEPPPAPETQKPLEPPSAVVAPAETPIVTPPPVAPVPAAAAAGPAATAPPVTPVAETSPLSAQASEDLKVKLPAGAAAHSSRKIIWLILAATLVTIVLAGLFMFLVK